METRNRAHRAAGAAPSNCEDSQRGPGGQDLKNFRYHHTLDCGHVIRTEQSDCAINCQIDNMPLTVKSSLPFVCYECSGASGKLNVARGRAKKSSQGVVHFLLGNDKASLMDKSKCCGSSGAQYMLRNTRQRGERASAPAGPKRSASPSYDAAPPAKRAKGTSPGQPMTPSLRPRMRPELSGSQTTSPAHPSSSNQRKSGLKDSKRLLEHFAPTTTKIGQDRMLRSERVWGNYGVQSNINSLTNSLGQFYTGSDESSMVSPCRNKPTAKASVKSTRSVIWIPEDPVVENIKDYFPNIDREDSPPIYIESESESEDLEELWL